MSVGRRFHSGGWTDHTTWCLHSFGLTVQLVAEALDVIQTIGNDYVIARQHPLDGRIFLRAGIFLRPGSMVDVARDAKRLIVDQMDFESIEAGIGVGGRDLGLEVLL